MKTEDDVEPDLVREVMESEAAKLSAEQVREAVDSMMEDLDEELAKKLEEAHAEGVKYVDVGTRTETVEAVDKGEVGLPFTVKYKVVKTDREHVTPGCSRRIHVHRMTDEEVAEALRRLKDR